MSENDIEKEIQAKGLNAPRLTPADIDAVIESKQFRVFPGTMLTVCCLTLVNGFNVVGCSACASPENFNQEIGEKLAFEDARNKVWGLEGYLLKQKLFEESWPKPTVMTAKVTVTSVNKLSDTHERVTFCGVTSKPFDENGFNDDNTFAKYSPQLDLSITIANPNLLGIHEHGQKYYLDFVPADKPENSKSHG